ncbi:MAG: SDR family oxidoreductase [Nitrospinota bacterium]|nr:SDR family oxidoreductase [Nitrospinota bacterium]
MSLDFNFEGKKILLTGVTGDVGSVLASSFLEYGAKLYGIGKSPEKINAMQSLEGIAKYVAVDFNEIEKIKTTARKGLNWLGGCDIFIHTAAYMQVNDPLSLSESDWKYALNINLLAPYFFIQEAFPFLCKSCSGRIILFGSGAGKHGGIGTNLSYGACKGGILAMVFNLAREFAKTKVTVNCLVPGPIDGRMMKQFDQTTLKASLSRHPMGRFGLPEEIVSATLFLASEETAHINGEAFDVNGGYYTD